MLRFVALLALSVVAPAWGACTRIINQAPPLPDTWRCADTGDEYTNGTDLFNFLNTASNFTCGDTIILDAGATYTGSTALQPAFILRTQTTCIPGKYTRIVSSRLSELPEGQRVSEADKPEMPILRTRTSYPVFGLRGSANNYRLEGLFLTNHQTNLDNNTINSALAMWLDFSPTTALSTMPANIIVDRCLTAPIDRDTYGDADVSNTEGRAQFSTASVAFFDMFVRNFQLINSSVYGYTGFRKSTEVAWTSISNASTAVITATGISAALGLNSSSLSDSRCTGITGCNGNCFEALGCARVVAVDGAGDWLDLNGLIWLRMVTADTVEVHKYDYANKGWFIPGTATLPYDSTSKGTPTAGIKLYKALLLTQYGYYSPGGFGGKIVNNFIETWGNAIFLGGANTTAYDPAVIQSGSTSTSIVLNHVRELKVGDYMVVEAVGKSAYCTSSAWGCWVTAGTPWKRVGKVTALAGNTATVTPIGADGIDIAPTIGGYAQWRGPNVQDLEMRGNTLYLSATHSMPGAGKGPMEIKDCVNCLFDGNVLGPNGGNYFLTARNQTGRTPWSRGENIRLSNNVSLAASLRLTTMHVDNEHTNMPGGRVVWEHNIHPGSIYRGAGSAGFMDGNGLNQSGWRHNTLTAEMAHPAVRAFQHLDCTISPTNAPEASPAPIIKDNIISYGSGIVGGNNCSSISSFVLNNLFVDTSSVGTGVINAAWPANSSVANYTGLFTSTCDKTGENWKNCSLAPASPYAGTASDGGDPGADVQQVNDRINGWSEDAGLIVANTFLPGMVLNSGNWRIGSTAVAVTFRLFASTGEGCTVELFTVRNRTGPHDDSSPAQTCSRTGSVAGDSVITYIFGTTSPLTPATTYFYRITDGARIMVGEFTTAAASSAISHTWSRAHECGPDQNFGIAVAAGIPYSLTAGTIGYCRETTPTGRTKVLVAP